MSNRITRTLAGVAWATSTSEERTQLGLTLHDAFEHSQARATAGLFDWEERWFEHALPPPPARVLVGAAGEGREALVLQARGYRIDAFEPADRAFTALRSNLGDSASVWQLTYQQLTAAVQRREFAVGPYEAVLLGWGSFGCVLEDQARIALLRACDQLCPSGPILASFAADHGRLRGLGRAGRLAAESFGATMPDRVCLIPNGGFIRPLRRDEAEHLGRIIGRTTVWAAPIFGHATWMPASAPES